ncbi:MAG: citrate synthase [Devosia sp.]|nr:citrate synthase [Devosia sp.]
MWLTAHKALERLKSKPQSLYASVSRGRIRARPDPSDSRRSLYSAEDVERLAERARGRRSATEIAASAIAWGDPVLSSAISTIRHDRLIYRGRDAALLAETMPLEAAADLLWDGPCLVVGGAPAPVGIEAKAAALVALARRAASDRPSADLSSEELRRDAGAVLGCLAGALLGDGDGPLHLRLAARLGRPEAADPLRRALVLLADHELNASTFAVRVAVSTGASLAAGTLAGLAALGGPRHGERSAAVAVLADDIGGSSDPAAALREWLGEGRGVPGFGHRLYPRGDARARALAASFELPAGYRRLSEAAGELTAEFPNIDFALAALCAAFNLPRYAPFTVFALGRATGWLAHAMEQAVSRVLIRPRACYVGPVPRDS